MDPTRLRALLLEVKEGTLTPDSALSQLQRLPFEDMGFARIDHHRHLRSGMPEVVFGEAKTAEVIVAIAGRILSHHGRVLVTRVDREKAEAVRSALPELAYDSVARAMFCIKEPKSGMGDGRVAVVTAGTSDLFVAEEAAVTLQVAGIPVERLYDVGVAGLHRLLGELERLAAVRVVIVVAGMEGALPSVVGGLVDRPVIGVPTSVGYGAALGGFAALLGMLTSCASGVSVVNIDNGFGAAMAALRIVRLSERQERDE